MVQAALDARDSTEPGFPLFGMQPQSFRKLGKSALGDTGAPSSYTPYSLLRGGATCWFQATGSFDVVVESWSLMEEVEVVAVEALDDDHSLHM